LSALYSAFILYLTAACQRARERGREAESEWNNSVANCNQNLLSSPDECLANQM